MNGKEYVRKDFYDAQLTSSTRHGTFRGDRPLMDKEINNELVDHDVTRALMGQRLAAEFEESARRGSSAIAHAGSLSIYSILQQTDYLTKYISITDTGVSFVETFKIEATEPGSNELGRCYIVEEFIPETFRKFSGTERLLGQTNDGEVNQMTANAFAHFSLHRTEEKMLMVDLQGGVKKKYGTSFITFSDPQTHTVTYDVS